MNRKRAIRRLEMCNVILALRLLRAVRKELKTNKLLDLKEMWILSRIHSQVMATLGAFARADKVHFDLERLRRLTAGGEDSETGIFLDENFKQFLKDESGKDDDDELSDENQPDA